MLAEDPPTEPRTATKGKDLVAAGCDSGHEPCTTLQILWQLGLWGVYNTIAGFCGGLLIPIIGYLWLNHFAAKYTDLPPEQIHCELSTQLPYCKAAVLDSVWITTVIAVLRPLVNVVLHPAVGALSDDWGRRKMLVIIDVGSQIPLGLMCMSLAGWGSTYMFWSAFSTVIFDASLCWGTVNSAIIDRVPREQDRASALGLAAALTTLSNVLGLLVGYQLPLHASFRAAVVADVVQVLFVLICIPETLQPCKRQAVNRQSLFPGLSLKILWRDPLLQMITLLIAVAVFSDAGFQRVIPYFMQRELNFNLQSSYLLGLTADLSTFVWLAFLFKGITDAIGEIGSMILSGVAMLFFTMSLFVVQQVSSVMVIHAAFVGPMSFAVPALAGLKSQLVSDSEQGALQGAISALVVAAGSLGSVFMGSVFSFAEVAMSTGGLRASMMSLACLAFLMKLALVRKLPRLLAERKPSGWRSLLAEKAEG